MALRDRISAITGCVVAVFLLIFILHSLFAETSTVEIYCQKSFYTPDRIVLKKGEPVKLVLRSRDVTHGFAVDEWDIAVEVSPGPPVIITVRPQAAGEFTFYCVVRCGKNHLQMRGTFIVE